MDKHIIGGYQLHLYCSICGEFGDFSAHNKGIGIRHARQAGWSVDVKHDAVRCPEHKGKRVKAMAE